VTITKEQENPWQKNVLDRGPVIAVNLIIVSFTFVMFLLFIWNFPRPERGIIFIVILVALVLMSVFLTLRHPRWVFVDRDEIRLRDGYGRKIVIERDDILGIKLVDTKVSDDIYHLEFRSPKGVKAMRVLSKECGKLVVERMGIEEKRMMSKSRLF
jgi:hypothetical protein